MAIPRRFAIFRGVAPPKRSRSVGVQSLTVESTGMDKREKEGLNAIAKAVAQCKPPVIVVEMLRNFGDVLHSTWVVRHYRKTFPGSVVWAISSRYVSEFDEFTLDQLGPHAIAPLPEPPPCPADGPYRKAWVKGAAALPGVVAALGCGYHPWGCPGNGVLTECIRENAKIKELAVPLRPWLPISQEDEEWAETFIAKHNLRDFVALEYRSNTLRPRPIEWFNDLVAEMSLPVVAIAGRSEPRLTGVVDASGCSYRQAKALISRCKTFIGCGSGLTMVAATDGCDPEVIELVSNPLRISMAHVGYRKQGDRHQCMPYSSAKDVARSASRPSNHPRISSGKSVRVFVPQPLHLGFFSQLVWLFPDIEWVLEGSTPSWLQERPIENFFPLSTGNVAFSHQTLEEIQLKDFDFTLGVLDEPFASSRKLRTANPIIWRSYFVPVNEQLNGPVVYSAEHVRRRSRTAGTVIREVRDASFWNGWRGGTYALIVARDLSAHPARFKACGGDFLKKLRGLVPTLELTSACPVPLEDLRRAYQNCGVFVEAPPSITDYPLGRVFSGSLIEAMFVGAPIVVRDCNEFGLIIGNDQNGLSAKSDEGIIGAIKRVLGDKCLATRLGSAARKSAVSLFDAAATRKQWVGVFKSIGVHVNATL